MSVIHPSFWNSQANIDALTELIRKEDLEVMNQATGNPSNIGEPAQYVGMADLIHGSTTAPVLSIPVVLAKEYWISSHGKHQAKNQILMQMTSLVSGSRLILINRKAIEMIHSENLPFLFDSVIAHELGHVLAGHFTEQGKTFPQFDTYTDKDRTAALDEKFYETVQFEIAANNLVKGGVWDIEFEADRYASAIVGMNNILASLAFQMATCSTTGIRFEVQNRIAKHLQQCEEVGYTPSTIRGCSGLEGIRPKDLILSTDILPEEEWIHIGDQSEK